MSLVVRSRAYSAQLAEDASVLEDSIWQPFGFLSNTAAHAKYYSKILEEHADLQLCLVDENDDKPVALVNCVPFSFEAPLTDLPQEGWDWLVEAGSDGNRRGANLLGALAVSVPRQHRGKGYARRMIRELKAMAEKRRFEAVVVPVRPSDKWLHPFTRMNDYIRWEDNKGDCFDPWLRSHLNEGAQIIGTCERSMVVRERVAFWEPWAGKQFEKSGRYAFNGGLAPVEIDLAARTGTYEEPNVWVGYQM